MRLPSTPAARPSARISSTWAQASLRAYNNPRPVASRRPRMPPCVTGLPVTQAAASRLPGLSAADAAFHRQLVVTMLDTPGLNHLNIAPGLRQRKFKPVDAVATLDLIQQP